MRQSTRGVADQVKWIGSVVQRIRQGRHHLSNLSSFMVARVLAVLIYFAPVPLFINKQGEAAYAALTLLLLVFSYLHVFDLGIGYAVNQRFARALARGNTRAHEIVQYALPVFIASALAVSALVLIGARPLAEFLTRESAYAAEFRLLSLCVGCLMLSALLTAIMQAYNRVDWINYSRLILDAARAAGLAAGAYAAQGVRMAIVFAVVGCAIKVVVDFALAARLVGGASRLAPRFRRGELGLNVRLGLPMAGSLLLGVVMISADRVFVVRFFGKEALAHYSVAADLCSKAYFLVWAVTGSIYTLYVKRQAMRQSADELIKVSLLSVGLVAVLYYLPLALLARVFLSWWIGPEFAEASADVTRIWTVAAVAYLVMCVYHNHLQGSGKPRLLIWGTFIGCSALLLTLFASRPFGIEGAAFAVFVGFAVQTIFLYMASRRLSASRPA